MRDQPGGATGRCVRQIQASTSCTRARGRPIELDFSGSRNAQVDHEPVTVVDWLAAEFCTWHIAASVGNRASPQGGGASGGVLTSASDDDGGGLRARCASSSERGSSFMAALSSHISEILRIGTVVDSPP